MTTPQIILFALMALLFVFLIWGRFRYDLVAFSVLMIALIVGVVPVDQAFSGGAVAFLAVFTADQCITFSEGPRTIK
jgi:di/tricarboxylate transporter